MITKKHQKHVITVPTETHSFMIPLKVSNGTPFIFFSSFLFQLITVFTLIIDVKSFDIIFQCQIGRAHV